MNSRFVIAGSALMVLLAVAGPARVSAAIEIRQAVTPQEAAALRAKGTPWTGPVLDAEQARVHALREDRMRKMPHRLAPEGFDWGAAIRARVGPTHLTRNPHARTAARSSASAVAAAETLRVALIRIDFQTDRLGSQTTGNGRFDLSAPDTLTPPIDRPPRNKAFYEAHLEAQRRYFEAQSYGGAQVVGEVWPRDVNGAYRVSDMADFGPWRFSQDIYGQAVHMMRTFFFAADSQSTASGDRIPWDRYDGFMLVHAGSDFQSDLRGDSEYDIPSFTLGVEDTNLIIFPDSLNIPIGAAMIVPETVNQDGFFAALNGVFVHEQGHNLFGFADLYDINTGFPVVGYWSLMDSGNLVGSLVQTPAGETIYAVGLLPPSIDPFQKFFIFNTPLDYHDVTWGDTMRVANSERNPDVRRLWMSSDEYLLIENRAILAGDTLQLDQDSTTRVILGPEAPDRFEYDALLPGPGMLIWHIDASVIPFSTALRQTNDFGWNTNPARLGISVVEADKLGDLGDPGSPFMLGSYFDPWFVGNQTTLSDSTVPPLRPHIKTRTHARLDIHDPPLSTMRMRAVRTWNLANWPVAVDLAPEGIEPLIQDADGDGVPEVCWAGGGAETADSASVFAVKWNGEGLFDPAVYAFATLPARPLQPLAAWGQGPVPAGEVFRAGPAYFAVTTRQTGDPGNPGGQVFLLDHTGAALPGWPPALPAAVTTPPIIQEDIGRVVVGAADGKVYSLMVDGTIEWASTALSGPISGRLASMKQIDGTHFVAAGSATGQIMVCHEPTVNPEALGGWTATISGPGFEPDFLWLSFDGNGTPASGPPDCKSPFYPNARFPSLIVHHANQLWGFCAIGGALPGWGRAFPDSFLPGLGAGDVDGDGYVEVLAQTRHSGVVFFNESGAPSPGWPLPTTRDNIPAGSPVLALDVDGDNRPEMVSFDGSGKLNAIRPDYSQPEGWPLALGAGANGAPVGGDLNDDGILDVIAPDRALNDSLQFLINGRFENLYGFTIPAGNKNPLASPWTMVGGDPGRTSALPPNRIPVASASAAGGPLIANTLKAYPNPARRKPIAFAFQLTEPATVDVDIVDTSGQRVAQFTVDGLRADNVAVWDPGKVPAGLYLARLRFRGPSGEHSEVMQVGVLR